MLNFVGFVNKRLQISSDDVSLRFNKLTRFTKAYNNCCYYVSVDFCHFDNRIFDPKPRVDCTLQYWQIQCPNYSIRYTIIL